MLLKEDLSLLLLKRTDRGGGFFPEGKEPKAALYSPKKRASCYSEFVHTTTGMCRQMCPIDIFYQKEIDKKHAFQTNGGFDVFPFFKFHLDVFFDISNIVFSLFI